MLVSPMLASRTYTNVPHKRPPTFTPHTHKGGTKRILKGACPPSVLLFARAARAAFVCGVNVGGLLCGTSIEFIESAKSIESTESVESSDFVGVYRVYRAYRIYRILRIQNLFIRC